jgi:hypothetical protein
MNREQVWKNFDLGQEVSVSGVFIYNGLRRFHEMQTLDHTDEVFEFFYNLSVGLERLLKVVVVLLEHDGSQSQEEFERSLITHNHLELLNRVKQHTADLGLGWGHNEFLDLLGTFYKTLRYHRFMLTTDWNPDKEKVALRSFLEKHLQATLESPSSILATLNNDRFRKYIGNIVSKISGELYQIVRRRASELNLSTYELRSGSKAEKIFLKDKCNFNSEDVIWKELLVFFMNTDATSGLMSFLRSIDPLDFDIGRAKDYLQCFQSEADKSYVMDELEELYLHLDNSGQRLEQMGVIGNPNVYFDTDDDEDEGIDSVFDSK